MADIFPNTIIWWVTVVDIPLITAAIISMSRMRKEIEGVKIVTERKLVGVKETLADFKLEVAQSYASLLDLKDVEGRLIAHLLRIEAKLDQTALKAHALYSQNNYFSEGE